MSTPIARYVCGFLFSEDRQTVALIRKNKPAWQCGRLNGIGGKIEEGESPNQAMRREFREEAGADIVTWRAYAAINSPEDCAEPWEVYFYFAFSNRELRSMTNEPIALYPVVQLHGLPVIYNLRWLIPLALDDSSRSHYIEGFDVWPEMCPKCHGVPVRPDIERCAGCIECDFVGTHEAYAQTQQRNREAFEAWDAHDKVRNEEVS
jgi:8-oxo-dGTP diphosphatase